MTVFVHGMLEVEVFETEYALDAVMFHHVDYSKDGAGLNGQTVVPYDTFHWVSDYSVVAAGWEICVATNPPTKSPTTSEPTSPTTSEPTAFDCEASETIEIEILSDNFPGEIAWTLSDDSSSILMSVDSSTLIELAESLYTWKYCNYVEGPSPYVFQITDTYGDGICCSYGLGEYKVYAGGELVATGGAFGSEANHGFCMNCDGSDEVEYWDEVGGSPADVVFTGDKTKDEPLDFL